MPVSLPVLPVRHTLNRRFGIAHVVIISATEASCQNIITAFSGPVCCVWEDVKVPSNHKADEGFRGQWDHRMLWFIRWVVVRHDKTVQMDYIICRCQSSIQAHETGRGRV